MPDKLAMTACTDKDDPLHADPDEKRRLLLDDSCHGLAVGARPAGGGSHEAVCICEKGIGILYYFRPTTEQRYTSSVTTMVISGLGPAAAALTSSSETNWCGGNPGLKTMRF